MSGRDQAGRSGLLMLELVIAVGIFAFCAAVCVSLFVRADTISRESAALDRAVAEAQNVAELFKSTGGDVRETAELASGWVEQGLLLVAYDEDWCPLSSGEGAVYQLDLFVGRTDRGCVEASLTLREAVGQEVLLSWPVAALEVMS